MRFEICIYKKVIKIEFKNYGTENVNYYADRGRNDTVFVNDEAHYEDQEEVSMGTTFGRHHNAPFLPAEEEENLEKQKPRSDLKANLSETTMSYCDYRKEMRKKVEEIEVRKLIKND